MYSPKQLKQDLVYSVKTLQKAGKMLSVMGNLWVVDGHYTLDDTGEFDPFDALVVVKDFPPSIAHADPKSVFNISSFDVIAENTKIPVSDLYRVGEGFCCVHSGESDSFYDIGCYPRHTNHHPSAIHQVYNRLHKYQSENLWHNSQCSIGAKASSKEANRRIFDAHN
jgi:hypothetical protein